MNNYQKYENELKDIIVSNMNFCGSLCDFMTKHCNYDVDCIDADSCDCEACLKRFREWLDKEYIIELTSFEREFLSNLKDKYRYITKDEIDGGITIWETYPVLDLGYWITDAKNIGDYIYFDCFSNLFSSFQTDRIYDIKTLLNR